MESNIAIQARAVGKCYHMYNRPIDRLKQTLWRGKRQFFSEFWAVRDVSIDIKKGETVGIIGSNGSGKSTLLQLVCGILEPTSGTLFVNGRIAALLELGAGFNPEFTGSENVFMNAAIMGLSQSEIEAAYDDIIAFSGIGDFVDRPVKTYSSGMYVRLAFAIAIHVSPEILVIDEALSVGDIRFQQKCMDRIRAFCENGTVFFVSHDMGAICELCTRAIWVEKGRIRMDGIPKEVVKEYVRYMYEETGSKSTADDSGDAGLEKKSVSSESDADFIAVGDDVSRFGKGNAVIEKIRMISGDDGNGIVYSGKSCEIGVILTARERIEKPIIGFLVKDRLGRVVIGDNTALIKTSVPVLEKNRRCRVDFLIEKWPNIKEGEYTLSIAIANGTMENHVQCNWLNDVIAFTHIPERTPAGIMSILETRVKILAE